jgi:hypothetical protein
MSSILMYINDEIALVATDTLVTKKGGEPLSFTSKALYLPHLHTIIAATGLAGISSKWFVRINDDLAVKGFEDLNGVTTQHLQDIYSRIDPAHQSVGTTVYQIGVSEIDGTVHGYTYSSQHDFQPRPLPRNQIGGKPAMGDQPDIDPPEVFTQLMRQQIEIQLVEPEDSRIHIGGEIQIIFLDAKTRSAQLLKTHRFEDYDKHSQHIFGNRT